MILIVAIRRRFKAKVRYPKLITAIENNKPKKNNHNNHLTLVYEDCLNFSYLYLLTRLAAHVFRLPGSFQSQYIQIVESVCEYTLSFLIPSASANEKPFLNQARPSHQKVILIRILGYGF